MKAKTHRLLAKAHKIVISVTGKDVSKARRDERMKEVRAIYKKIKTIEPAIYQILNADDNHKTVH